MTLTSLAAVSCTVEPAKKKLPASSMTVGKLKQLCKRLFKVDTDQQVFALLLPAIGVFFFLVLLLFLSFGVGTLCCLYTAIMKLGRG